MYKNMLKLVWQHTMIKQHYIIVTAIFVCVPNVNLLNTLKLWKKVYFCVCIKTFFKKENSKLFKHKKVFLNKNSFGRKIQWSRSRYARASHSLTISNDLTNIDHIVTYFNVKSTHTWWRKTPWPQPTRPTTICVCFSHYTLNYCKKKGKALVV